MQIDTVTPLQEEIKNALPKLAQAIAGYSRLLGEKVTRPITVVDELRSDYHLKINHVPRNIFGVLSELIEGARLTPEIDPKDDNTLCITINNLNGKRLETLITNISKPSERRIISTNEDLGRSVDYFDSITRSSRTNIAMLKLTLHVKATLSEQRNSQGPAL